MGEDENNQQRSLLDQLQQMRHDADKGREPELLSSRMGTRHYSTAALLERIVDQFIAEHAGDSQLLREADTQGKRYKLILGVTDYVLAVESVQISNEDKAAIMRRVYTELFTYGPLDTLFEDETITTITLEGADKIAVRYGHGDLTPLNPVFENEMHLRKIVQRLLLNSGVEMSEEIPIIEAGLRLGDRPVSINIVSPPVTYTISADIRIHLAQPITLDDLVADEVMTNDAAQVLTAIARSLHGLVIVGETESGKTTLLSALANLLEGKGLVGVERADALHLPEGAGRHVVLWPMEGRQPRAFSQLIKEALKGMPHTLLLDEVRADEAAAVYPLLERSREDVPRQIWVFRGPANTKRLIAALGMLARRSIPDDAKVEAGERMVQVMYERLPFVVTLRRRQGKLQLHSISEWQFREGEVYPDFIELMVMGWEGLEFTGRRPLHELDLIGKFWD